MSATDHRLFLGLSGELHLKSPRTQRRLRRVLRENVQDAIARTGGQVSLQEGPPGRWSLQPLIPSADLATVAEAAGRVFGIHHVELVRSVPRRPVGALVDGVATAVEDRVRGRTFAVRAKVRGSEPPGTMELERLVGSRLLASSAGVDLDDPEVTVRVHVWPDAAYVEQRRFAGGDGLPLRTQAPVLALLSGGFDSAVAAWLMMRRGAPVDLVHFVMDCAQSEHAVAVAFELWQRWGAGTEPSVWLVDFQPVKQHLLRSVDDRHRQVALKRLMLEAAERVAAHRGHEALVTGDSVGQVSTQTVSNLARIDEGRATPVLRPLSGFTKEEIMDRARAIGTHQLSSRAREVCDLSSGPVETAARPVRLLRSMADLPEDLVEQAVAASHRVHLPTWAPGQLPSWTAS